MKTTRLAIIGAGNHAKASHYTDPALIRCPEEVTLCAACDLDADKLAQVRDRFNLPATYTDFREMIARERPDGTVIVLPPVLLPEIACECMKLGQHVIVEKPPGCNWTETQQILDMGRQLGRKVMCSLDRRFFPLVQLLKRKLVPERINHFNLSYNKGFFGWSAPSNLFTADAIHLVDLVLHLGGPVSEVHAYASRRGEKHLRSFSAVMKLRRGGFATMNCHYANPPGRHGRRQLFEVTSDDLCAYLDLGPTMQDSPYGGTGWIIEGTQETTVAEYFARIEGEPPPESSSEMLNFARWIRGEAEPLAALDNIIESVKVTEAVAAGFHGDIDLFTPVFNRNNAP